MLNAPCVCNGEKTGYVCKHYWSVMQKFSANNAETMRDGEKQRACTLMNGWPLEFYSEEFPTRILLPTGTVGLDMPSLGGDGN